MTTPQTALIYSRFSPRPNAAECESIELQNERCMAYCTAHGYVVAERFEDRDLSGGCASNRPGLQAALSAACRCKAALVCYSLSRLARSVRDAVEIADRLNHAGANLVMLDLNVDTTTPMGRCVFSILAAVAELERTQIAQRTSDAMQRHQANGRRMSRFAPVGKAIGENGTLIDDLTFDWAGARTSCRQWHAEHISLREMARRLEDETGRKWYHTTVKQLLR